MSVTSAEDITNKGRALVIVALVDDLLNIRIFDANGKKVVDKPENELVGEKAVTALKQQLDPLPVESGLSQDEKQQIIENATSSAGHIQETVRFNAKKRVISQIKTLRDVISPWRCRQDFTNKASNQ